MDRFFYQLTVLACATCVSVISFSMLFPSTRRADLTELSPKIVNADLHLPQPQNK